MSGFPDLGLVGDDEEFPDGCVRLCGDFAGLSGEVVVDDEGGDGNEEAKHGGQECNGDPPSDHFRSACAGHGNLMEGFDQAGYGPIETKEWGNRRDGCESRQVFGHSFSLTEDFRVHQPHQ